MRRPRKPKPYFNKKRKQWRARVRSGDQTHEAWFPTKAAAEEQIEEWCLARLAGVSSEGMTLGELSDLWLSNHQGRESSRVRYRGDIKLLEPIKDLQLHHLRRKVITAFLDDVDTSYKKKRAYHMLNQLFTNAVERELVATNVVRDIRTPRHQAAPAQIYSEPEIALIKTACDEPPYLQMVELMLEVGTRPGETYCLEWGDLVDGELHITKTMTATEGGAFQVSPHTKTTAGRRVIPLSDYMCGMLLKHRANQLKIGRASKTDLMFSNESGDGLHYSFRSTLRKKLRNAGVEYRKPHTFRHTAASAMLNGGVPVTIVAAILGHERPSITLHTYAHLIGTEQEKAKAFWDNERNRKNASGDA